MQYSPKLKNAMEDIKKILKEYDIAAVIVLHNPGFSEYLMKIDPSYSCAKFEHIPLMAGQSMSAGLGVRIRAKLVDFNGDREKQKKVISNTSNMLMHLGERAGEIALAVMSVSDQMDKITDAEHEEGRRSSHDQQNN